MPEVKKKFSLKPFADALFTDLFKIEASIYLSQKDLVLEINLAGPLDQLIVPPSSATRQYQEGLWEHHCFEVFLASLERDNYVEFNFSPSGNFAVMFFSKYRERVTLKIAEQMWAENFSTYSVSANHLQIVFSAIDLQLLGINTANFLVNFSCVLEHKAERYNSLWAIEHPLPDRADFHARDGFIPVSLI